MTNIRGQTCFWKPAVTVGYEATVVLFGANLGRMSPSTLHTSLGELPENLLSAGADEFNCGPKYPSFH